jgi:hypothetical protein
MNGKIYKVMKSGSLITTEISHVELISLIKAHHIASDDMISEDGENWHRMSDCVQVDTDGTTWSQQIERHINKQKSYGYLWLFLGVVIYIITLLLVISE